MNERFRIGDFLFVEGPDLRVDLTTRVVTGFSRVTIRDGATKLELDASPNGPSPHTDISGRSTIFWGKDDATAIEGGIELRKNKEAFVSFHWPNPLTPRGFGLFFRISVEREDDGYRLRFRRDDLGPEDGRRRGYGYFQEASGAFERFFLANGNGKLTAAEWRAQWVDRAIANASAESIQRGPLFAGEGAALIDGEPDDDNWKFGWRFVTGTDGISRAIAAVDIEKETLAVNARALRLEERSEIRPRPLRWDRKVLLRCASVRSDGPAGSWAIDWHGVPTFERDARKDHFSLRAFWQELARHWALGLRSLRSRNALTFVPTDIGVAVGTTGAEPWVFRFRCDRIGNALRTQLANIGRPQPLKLRFELGSLLDTNGRACTFESLAGAQSGEMPFEGIVDVTERGLDTLLDFDLKPSAESLGKFLVGGLVLDLGKLRDGELRVDWAAVRTQLGQPPIDMRLRMRVSGGSPRPGTEDPERGFESENDLLQRERPLVIDLSAQASSATVIDVLEVAGANRSRVLEVLVRSDQDDSIAGAPDVVVIDPAPLLVARVHTSGVGTKKETILASYRDDGERPPGWELHTDTGAMTLVLPPQAIGEEMIKGNLTVLHENQRKRVPFTDRPFDFRLSPPARLTLDRTDIDTARAAAPWALRRLLDRREGVVGLKLDAARFELLYGLTARIENVEGLRVAEQDAFVGRVPIAPAIRERSQETLSSEVLFPKIERDYASDAVKWIRSLFARPAQLPVFRDFAKRERLVVSDGVTFAFRPSRQTVHPLRLDEPSRHSVNEPAADFGNRLRLRGGVDYPFESENIYNVVLDNEQKASTGQPQGHVSGLVFGALGGTGSQQAGFDEGRSIIITDTTQGRLNSLTLIRVGRIAMLWHHARHVIVYERTTRTAPRYEHEQPNDFEGLAALRKVKEYIEITQPRRSYPDFATPDERPAAGPVTGCTFETIVIPVKSSWGHDIEEGWVMALRGPLLDHEEPFYPMPKIFLELARAESKGSGAINHLAADPSQLLFFTTTRESLGADTDRWPAWPDIDFPLTLRPVPPKVRFLPGFSGANHQPDAAGHDYGQRRFTIDVIPPEEAANLLHGRPGSGLEARVRNVSFARGGGATKVRSAIDDLVGVTFAEAEARIGDGLGELAQHLEGIAQRSASTAAEVSGLRAEARAVLADARGEAERMIAAVKGAGALLDAGVGKWNDLQARTLANAKSAADAERARLAEKFSDDIAGVVTRLRAAPQAPPLDEARASLRAASESVCRQAMQRVEGAPFLAADVRDRLDAEIRNARNEVRDEIERLRAAWHARVEKIVERIASESPTALESELFEVVLDGRARVAAFGAGFGRLVKGRLGPLFGDIVGDPGAVGRLTRAVEDVVRNITEGIDETLEVIPPFGIAAPDKEQLIALLDGVFPDLDVFDEVVTDLLAPLLAPLQEWQTMIADQVKAIEDLCSNQTQKLLDALDQGANALEAIADSIVDEWSSAAGDAFDTLLDEAETRLGTFMALPQAVLLQGAIDRVRFLEAEVRDAIGSLESALDDATKSVRDLAGQAGAVAQRAGAGLRRIGEQVEQAVAKELRNVVRGAEAAALELTRALAEGPVTDTLRCTRDWVGYYYERTRDALDVTRAAAVFNDLGGSVLNSLAAQVPFDRIRERVLAQLGNFDINKLFPDFAGLKLEHLLSGMKIPSDPSEEYDWLKMRHGFDRARLTAWSEIAIDKTFDDSPALFTLPPVTLNVLQPRFTATSRIEADANGARAQHTRALLVADWSVTLNGQPIMTIENGGLYFDLDGGFRFDFSAQDLRLAPALQFVTDAIRSLLPPEEGLTLTPIPPGGISVELSLPLPDIGTGAFTMTGITLYTHFDLLVVGGFEVRTGLWLSRPERPFGIAVLFLGGGGWFGVDVRYKPPKEFETRVSVGLAAGAFVALNFGVARGSAGILFTVSLDFYRNWLQSGSQDLAISIGILVWGEFSILSIVSAYLRVVLRVEYRNGSMTGYGSISLSIKICWCFTLRVHSNIRLPFKGSGRSSQESIQPAAAVLNAAAAIPVVRPTVAQALDAHFANLDV